MSNVASVHSERTSEPPKSTRKGTKAKEPKPSREEIAEQLGDSRGDFRTVENPLSLLDGVVYELGVAWHAACGVDGEVGSDLAMMLCQLRGRVRGIHDTLLTSQAPTPARDRENLAGLVSEAKAHVNTVATLYAIADADDDGCRPDHDDREAFNVAVGGIVSSLAAIHRDHCGAEGKVSR
jgi:hypothetical protein